MLKMAHQFRQAAIYSYYVEEGRLVREVVWVDKTKRNTHVRVSLQIKPVGHSGGSFWRASLEFAASPIGPRVPSEPPHVIDAPSATQGSKEYMCVLKQPPTTQLAARHWRPSPDEGAPKQPPFDPDGRPTSIWDLRVS